MLIKEAFKKQQTIDLSTVSVLFIEEFPPQSDPPKISTHSLSLQHGSTHGYKNPNASIDTHKNKLYENLSTLNTRKRRINFFRDLKLRAISKRQSVIQKTGIRPNFTSSRHMPISPLILSTTTSHQADPRNKGSPRISHEHRRRTAKNTLRIQIQRPTSPMDRRITRRRHWQPGFMGGEIEPGGVAEEAERRPTSDDAIRAGCVRIHV